MASTFAPTLPARVEPGRAEMLGRFVPTAISRIPPVARIKRPIQVAFFGILSAGIIPLLQLRRRVTEYVSLEQQQLDLAAELGACHLEPTAAQELSRAAERAKPSGVVDALADVALVGTIVFSMLAMTDLGWSLDAYRHLMLTSPTDLPQSAAAWFVAVCLSYVLLHLRINRHASRLHDFALAFNASTEGRLSPIYAPQFTWGVRVGHLIVAGVLMFFLALWALPMLLAWGAFQTFVQKVDVRFRSDLSNRLQQLSGVTPVVKRAGICNNPGCDQPLPPEARFCPRCGQRVGVG